MSDNLVYTITNLGFAVANLWFFFKGPYPRFSALCFGICGGATIITSYNYFTVG